MAKMTEKSWVDKELENPKMAKLCLDEALKEIGKLSRLLRRARRVINKADKALDAAYYALDKPHRYPLRAIVIQVMNAQMETTKYIKSEKKHEVM